ncbi:hypothetical protein KIW84_041911 [Lathyrus oleraceus]|uniref:Uncharacterized protein n=1 Tax=Pisum sativum TaxID=3888 RepID=A0A9D5ASB9_PEA|nr:hypothetical protein KIW84_041911 [Pisum sativum]
MDAAASMVEKAIIANPTYTEAYNNLGVLYKDVGDIALAINAYEQCLKIDPDSRNAGQNRLLAMNYIDGGSEGPPAAMRESAFCPYQVAPKDILVDMHTDHHDIGIFSVRICGKRKPLSCGLHFLVSAMAMATNFKAAANPFVTQVNNGLHEITKDPTKNYQGASFFMNDNYQLTEFTFGSQHIQLFCLHSASTDFDLIGQLVWPEAMLLNDYLSNNLDMFQGCTVIELGSGVGITGIFCRNFCNKVVSTDYNEEKDLIKSGLLTPNLGLFLAGSVTLKLGEGNSIPFWSADWKSPFSFAKSFEDLFAISKNKDTNVISIGATRVGVSPILKENDRIVWDHDESVVYNVGKAY